MSYNPNWNVFPGEIPTSQKWNQLGENDDFVKEEVDTVTAKLGNVELFVPRTFSSWDYNNSNDIGSWTSFNAAAIVPEGATRVLIRGHVAGSGSKWWMAFRQGGTSWGADDARSTRIGGNKPNGSPDRVGRHEVLVPLSATRTFEYIAPYSGGTANAGVARFVVIGYYIPFSEISV